MLENDENDENEENSEQDENLFIKISVEDTGVGIKPHDQVKLFKLFGYLTAT